MSNNEALNNEKQIRFASGIISCFGMNDKNRNGKPNLFFEGECDDNGEKIKRNIKISKYVKGYLGKDHSQIYRDQYPKKNHIYKGSVQLEAWDWEGHSCLRVIAFEIDEDLGENKDFCERQGKADENNPFLNRNK